MQLHTKTFRRHRSRAGSPRARRRRFGWSARRAGPSWSTTAAAALLAAAVADFERATGPWEIEWIVLPEIFCLSTGALDQAVFMLEGLVVHADAMEQPSPYRRAGEHGSGDDGARSQDMA